VRRGGGDDDVIIQSCNGLLISLGDNSKNPRFACLAFSHVSEGFIFAGAFVTERNDRNIFIKQGNGTVFELGGMVALSVDV